MVFIQSSLEVEDAESLLSDPSYLHRHEAFGPDMARKYDDSNLLVQLKASVERAFRQLGYANPRAETRLLLIILNGLMAELVDEDHIDQEALLNFIKQKYQLK